MVTTMVPLPCLQSRQRVTSERGQPGWLGASALPPGGTQQGCSDEPSASSEAATAARSGNETPRTRCLGSGSAHGQSV